MLTPDYWTERYATGRDGWDIGGPNLGLLAELTKRIDLETRVLIPGAGRAHEALWLWERGYGNVYVCDWAAAAFEQLREAPQLPHADRLIVADFFELQQRFGVIFEQTFFCAIDPSLRTRYVDQCHELLGEGGRVIGLLFDRSFGVEADGSPTGPPFGGDRSSYSKLFASKFDIDVLATFQNSIGPRQGSEVLLIARAKNMNVTT